MGTLASGTFESSVDTEVDTDEYLASSPIARPLLRLMATLEERHPELSDHGHRVAAIGEQIALNLGLPRHRIRRTRLAARLHDVGKVCVPEAVLHKRGPLTEEEWTLVKRHPEVGAQLLMSSNLDDIAGVVVAHHERVDGRGYPHGACAADGPLEAQIVAVADAYDAMVSSRPYSRPLHPRDAVEEVRRCTGTQFDTTVVGAFLKVIAVGRLSSTTHAA
jgi:HD-GYP domain-containing protein (c-di-GMP phosphodiesterase class II)